MNRRELLGKGLALSAVGLLVPKRLLADVPRLIEHEHIKQFEFTGDNLVFDGCRFDRDVILRGSNITVIGPWMSGSLHDMGVNTRVHFPRNR